LQESSLSSFGMIHTVLEAIRHELDEFLKRRRQGSEPNKSFVMLSELVSVDGGVNEDALDKVIITLINVEQNRVALNARPFHGNTRKNPPVSLNLVVLISANYKSDQYLGALQDLSSVIGFFQGKQEFTAQNTPGLPDGVVKINAELVNLDMRELSNFWTAVGSKHLPSVIYKLRMISITADMILEEVREITGVETTPKTDQ
jgi:hypothetical protein